MPSTSTYSPGKKPGGGIDLVGNAAQAATDDLLAKKLRPEGAHAQDVRHGVGVPALGQHRHRDDAADIGAKLAGLPDRVHHFAKNVGVGKLVDVARIAAQSKFLLERFNLGTRNAAEILGERLARVELLAVDQSVRRRDSQRPVVVDV